MRIAWFSAGASSFLASWYAKPDRIIYIDVKNQHPDTYRFIEDAQRLLCREIEVIRDEKYGASVDEVIERTGYISGPSGARCSLELKKRVRQDFERTLDEPPTYVWGYDADEKRRADRIVASSEFANEFPLIERGLAKRDVHAIVAEIGLRRPAMYDLGYPNNNCVGCVKGGMGYWNLIRRDFPDVFERRARQERAIGHSCINGVFLDELEPDRGNMDMEVIPQCSFACMEMETA